MSDMDVDALSRHTRIIIQTMFTLSMYNIILKSSIYLIVISFLFNLTTLMDNINMLITKNLIRGDELIFGDFYFNRLVK